MHLWLSVAVALIICALSSLVLFQVWRAWRTSARQRRKQRGIARLAQEQQAAINWVIQETGDFGLPEQLQADLIRLHQEYPSVISGKAEREIY
jgi:type II secretory pathway pseudopilin PulG